MAAAELSFGYLPLRLSLQAGPITITTLPSFADTVLGIVQNDGVEGSWIYAPARYVRNLGGGESQKPYSSRVFGLPKTHTIRHNSVDSDQHLGFHLWVFSFLTGMRLSSTDAGFLDATPIDRNKLVDFSISDGDFSKFLEVAEAFWKRHAAERKRANLLAAAIHALFLGRNPLSMQFEQFYVLYSALDACFALNKSIHGKTANIPHDKRVKWMCELFNMPVPSWADYTLSGTFRLSELRNDAVHEALFSGQPLGFALHGIGSGENINLEMSALICRLICGILGFGLSDYVTSPVTSYQVQYLKL